MGLSRRSLLRAGGLAALFGGTALAGCTSPFGGPSDRPRDWQFDTEAVSETPNRFFGTVDHGELYENREYLPEQGRETVTAARYTPLDADSLASTRPTTGPPSS